MKREELEKHLRTNGCTLVGHGGRHDAWINVGTGGRSVVPRHREIAPGTVSAICKQLKVPKPAGK
jgi:predicted RNA binding protein YcfA (HicA-like mRNA interferase family)